jgi:hypothetical protein
MWQIPLTLALLTVLVERLMAIPAIRYHSSAPVPAGLPEDEGGRFLQNTCTCLQKYIALHPKRQ